MYYYIFQVLQANRNIMRDCLVACPFVEEFESLGYSGGSTLWDFWVQGNGNGDNIRDWIWEQENCPAWISFYVTD